MKKLNLVKYVGGKFKLLDKLIPMFPRHKNYVEPFCGSCTVLLNKPKSQIECVNDYNKDIWNLFNVIKNKVDEFDEALNWMFNSRYQFYLFREQDPEKLTDVERAVRFYYLLKCAYGGKMLNPSFSPQKTRPEGINFEIVHDTIKQVYNRMKNVHIENLDFAECIERYNHKNVFFFLDPPYFKEGKKDGKDRCYTHNFDKQDFERLNESLKTIEGKFLMTINNCDYTRNMYKDFNQSVLDHIYCLRTHPLHYNNCKSKDMNVTQLIVSNYDIKPRRYKLK